VLRAGQQWADAAAEHRFAADRDGVQRGAVEGVPHRHGLVPPGHQPGQLERHADGRRATGGEEQLGLGHRRGLAEPLRQLDGGRVGVAPRAEGQRRQGLLHRLHHLRVAVADLVQAVAVEIEDAPARQVGQPGPLGSLQGVQAGGGHRLVEEPACVLGEQRPRRLVQVCALPGLAALAEVDVALGGIGHSGYRCTGGVSRHREGPGKGRQQTDINPA
jgi:hypothetical protein